MLASALFASLPGRAFGELISYPGYTGTTVNYTNVSEDTTTGDVQPLFGAPIYSGNSVDFNPVGFDAIASGAGGRDDTGGRLAFTLEAHSGDAISSIRFSEAGDTALSGVGTDATSTKVSAQGTITINAVDGAMLVSPIVQNVTLAFTPSGGDYGLASDGSGLPAFHTQWTGSLAVNVAQIVANSGLTPALGATSVSVNLVNLLSARSEAGTQAVINKHDFGGLSITVNQPGGGGGPEIPEPASGLLAMAGLAGWLSAGRRFCPPGP
jgi:hypothetical protein